MTDKEQIMIDGVDVSGCEKYPLSNKWQGSIIFCKGGCNAYPNCEYKQLARKTQECEELKDKINIYKKMFDNSELRVALTDIRTGERDIREQRDRRLTKENEELKERLERTEEDLKYQCVDCMNVKSDRYRKALDEIEEYTKTTLRMPLERRVILDIITKAKEGNYDKM